MIHKAKKGWAGMLSVFLVYVVCFTVTMDMVKADSGGIIAALTGGTKKFTTLTFSNGETITNPTDGDIVETFDEVHKTGSPMRRIILTPDF